jgi:hypothetical protein
MTLLTSPTNRRKPWYQGLGVLCLSLCLSGCGPNAFVDRRFDESRDDRENLRLTGVDARVSSGSAELRRMRGGIATLDDVQGILHMDRVQVDTLSATGTVEAITVAGSAQAYLKDQSLVSGDGAPPNLSPGIPGQNPTSASLPRRNDFAFSAGVVHRIMGTATDTLRLQTDKLLWEQESKLFRAPGAFQVTVAPSAGDSPSPGMTMRGVAFVATAGMERWNVLGGSMASGTGVSPGNDETYAEERQRLLNDFSQLPVPPEEHFSEPGPIPIPGNPPDSETTVSVSTHGSP